MAFISHPPARGVVVSAPAFEQAVVPIILAAGSARELDFPKALARFGGNTAVEIALANCRGGSRKLGRPILVLGERAAEVRRQLPGGVLRHADCIVNQGWRQGQLASIKSALRLVPLGSAFMIYPVDLALLTREVIQRLVAGYRRCADRPCIIMPRSRGRFGHPVIFSPDLRPEIMTARTARDVAYRYPKRIHTVSVRTSAIWTDFSTPAEYKHCVRRFSRVHLRKNTTGND
jgi:CTP:molybdopterin cytidylyltransferase MocA